MPRTSLADPADYKLAHLRIKKLWEDGQTVILSHAQRRMKERGVDIEDVRSVVKYGRVTEHSMSGTNWRYRLDGRSIEGTPLACVFEIANRLLLVTVIC